nr:MAG TPA: hypothetical protein [Caudoviricetes sp.]
MKIRREVIFWLKAHQLVFFVLTNAIQTILLLYL